MQYLKPSKEIYTSYEDIPKRTNLFSLYHIDVPLDFLENVLDGYLKDYDLDINPDFQRGRVWTRDQSILYLEYLLSGGFSHRQILFNCPSFTSGEGSGMVLVDGLQRLSSILDFLNNKIPVYGTLCDNFLDKDRMLRGLGVEFYVAEYKRKEDVLRWYLEINSGGTPHTKDEIKKVEDLLDECFGENHTFDGSSLSSMRL